MQDRYPSLKAPTIRKYPVVCQQAKREARRGKLPPRLRFEVLGASATVKRASKRSSGDRVLYPRDASDYNSLSRMIVVDIYFYGSP